jgi:hypothetical protein
MTTSAQGYPARPAGPARTSRFAVIVSRVPLGMVTVIFSLIGLRFLVDPVRAATAMGIAFTSPGGVTVARVGFAAFPLAFAILAVACLLSARRVLAGLSMVFIVVTVVFLVRILGLALDHSGAENVRLLAPEAVLMALSALGIHLERGRRRRETSSAG